ncbi:hypothetical protein FRC09_000495 [Ceratobasidium sp. 395]|nr:hypothetical protein FRC09_000495 [Ceratobasidium sp. 395]
MTDLAVAMEVMIHKRAPRWGNDLSQITPKKALQDLLDRCWDRESSARPRAADVESQVSSVGSAGGNRDDMSYQQLHHVTEDGRRFALDEQISFEEFCELKINGVIRQIEFYNTGRWLTMDDIVLFEVETYDPFMGVHRPWIVVQTAPLISLSDGELRIAIQAFPSHEASGVGHHQRTRHLVSTNELVAITHLKRQLHLWSQYPGVSKHSFCFVVFECMKELFETAEVKNDYSFYLSLYGHIQAELEELKAQFLTYLEVVIDNS